MGSPMSRKLSLLFSLGVILTYENVLFELRATYLEFIISTQMINPAEFNDEETTTFRESTCLQNDVFLSK